MRLPSPAAVVFVADVARMSAFYRELFAMDLMHADDAHAVLGGEVWPVDREWEAASRGFRACDGRDPEGNVFQVRESL